MLSKVRQWLFGPKSEILVSPVQGQQQEAPLALSESNTSHDVTVPARHKLTIRDVFRPVGVPTITLIDRSYTEAYQEIRFHISDIGGLVSVHGASKSGKSVLCLDILKDYNPIFLKGQFINSEEHFWQAVARKLNIPDQLVHGLDSSELKAQESELDATIGGSIYGAAITARTSESGSTISSSRTAELHINGRHEIAEQIIKTRRPVVIDDFHAVPAIVQRDIIINFKPVLDEFGTLIVISIPEETGPITQHMARRGETLARHAVIPAPLWEPAEIRQIPEKGFAALNVQIDEETISSLVKFSYRNPLLMQYYCARLCFVLGIDKLPPNTPMPIEVDPETLYGVITHTANKYEVGFSDYIKLDDTSNRNWVLDNGKSVNIYVLILLSIAEIAIGNKIRISRIKERIDHILDNEVSPPMEATIAQSIQRMTERMSKELGSDTPLRYDSENKYAYITHPFFKVYLQWVLLPKFRGPRPLSRKTD